MTSPSFWALLGLNLSSTADVWVSKGFGTRKTRIRIPAGCDAEPWADDFLSLHFFSCKVGCLEDDVGSHTLF